jgi:hypothetical protein
MVSRLSDYYNQLSCSQRSHSYLGMEIKGCAGIYMAVDTNNLPSLFVNAETHIIEAPLMTKNVSLLPNQIYKITFNDGSQVEKLFHAIGCSSPIETDIKTFLSLLEAFIAENIDSHAASANVMPFFRNIVRLLSIQPARDLASERQGLWGELFVMRSTKGYRFWAPFWHKELNDIFDFSTAKKRLEVKTSASGQRIHHTNHRQVFALPEEEIVFASLIVKEDQSGISLLELINECKDKLIGSMYYFKIEKAARHAGMSEGEDSGPIYNLQSASDTLAFFHSEAIPHFKMPEPPGVTQTRFKADLTSAAMVGINWINQWFETWADVKTN